MNIKNIMACFANQALTQALPPPSKKKTSPTPPPGRRERCSERDRERAIGRVKMLPQAIPLSE